MHGEPKKAGPTLSSLNIFLSRAERAIEKLKLLQRMLNDPKIQKDWNENAVEVLRKAGIDPDTKMIVGFGGSEQGSGCDFCITQKGEACIC
jgi:hypothetical protein